MSDGGCLFFKCCVFLRQAQMMALCTVWMLALISPCLPWKLTMQRCQVNCLYVLLCPVCPKWTRHIWKMPLIHSTEVVVSPCLTNKLCMLIMIAGMWNQSLLRGLGGRIGLHGSLGSHYSDRWQHGAFINALFLCSEMEFSVRTILGFSCLHFKIYLHLCEMGIACCYHTAALLIFQGYN